MTETENEKEMGLHMKLLHEHKGVEVEGEHIFVNVKSEENRMGKVGIWLTAIGAAICVVSLAAFLYYYPTDWYTSTAPYARATAVHQAVFLTGGVGLMFLLVGVSFGFKGRYMVGIPQKMQTMPAQPATTIESVDPEPYYTHGDYRLYTRNVSLHEGTSQRIYFFSKHEPKSGSRCRFPAGYEVGINSRTGLPYLKKER